ncbi:MAG: GNAT family N-acetyltransferase [Acidobacteriota bacterium]
MSVRIKKEPPSGPPRLRYESFLTPRLEARAISWDHRDEIRRLYGDPQVGASFGGVSSAQEVDDSIERNLEHWARWGWGPWTAYDRTREGSPFVGQILLRRGEIDGVQEVEIGYALMPYYWRQGLGTESADALAWLGLEVLGLESVVAYTWVKNFGSWKVMEKIGMREEKRFPYLGQEHVLYRLRRKDRLK